MKFISSKFFCVVFVTLIITILTVNADQEKSRHLSNPLCSLCFVNIILINLVHVVAGNGVNQPNNKGAIQIEQKCSIGKGDCCVWFFKCLKCCNTGTATH